MEFEGNARTKVVFVGQVCMDRNILENGTHFEGLGSPAIFGSKIAKQIPGVSSAIIARHGRDFVENFKGYNLYPEHPTEERTLIYQNDSSRGPRTQKALNREYAQPAEIGAQAVEIISEAEAIVAAPILANMAPDYYIEIAAHKKPGAIVALLPQGHFRAFDVNDNVLKQEFPEARAVMPFVDMVIMSEEDHPLAENLLRSWQEINPSLIAILTMGEKGAASLRPDGMDIYPTILVPKEEIVDTVGCGDTFATALVIEYARTKDLAASIAFANAVAGQRLKVMADQIVIDVEKARRDAITSQNLR